MSWTSKVERAGCSHASIWLDTQPKHWTRWVQVYTLTNTMFEMKWISKINNITYLIAKADLLSKIPLSTGLRFLGLTSLDFLPPLKSKLDILFNGFRQTISFSDNDFMFCTTYVPPKRECLKEIKQFDTTVDAMTKYFCCGF